jgi:hypothetical protein
MRRTGITRRIVRSTGRSIASRQTAPTCAWIMGTARPGSGLNKSKPGHISLFSPSTTMCALPDCHSQRPTFVSLYMPLERKSWRGAIRRQFHEQGVAV